jgi:hypothetical protein
MPLSQHKTELALQWHRKHYNTEYIANLLNTTPEEIQTIINQHQQQTEQRNQRRPRTDNRRREQPNR